MLKGVISFICTALMLEKRVGPRITGVVKSQLKNGAPPPRAVVRGRGRGPGLCEVINMWPLWLLVPLSRLQRNRVRGKRARGLHTCKIFVLVSSLQQKGIGMNEPLVDCEGYPRADVDLYQVRTARHNIVCE